MPAECGITARGLAARAVKVFTVFHGWERVGYTRWLGGNLAPAERTEANVIIFKRSFDERE